MNRSINSAARHRRGGHDGCQQLIGRGV